MIGIYKITNKLNGKVYIGQSINIEKRWKQHINDPGYNIHNAIKKYGKENFSFEVLLECPAEMLNNWERDMIALYDCISPKGYNLTEGGEGYRRSEETRLKMSEAKKGKHHSEEHKRKISESKKGIHRSEETRLKMSNSRKGKHHSEETKIKISNAQKGIPLSEETRLKMSEAKKGKHLREETKHKISESHKGRHWKIENGKRIWY